MTKLRTELNLDNFFFDDDQVISSIKNGPQLSYLNNGKQLRSSILFKLSKILGINFKDSQVMGRVIEIIHNATLTHDDVIDNASLRRGNHTLNSTLGNHKAVLLGDYMLSKALIEISSLDKIELVRHLSMQLKKLVDGEWMQYECVDPFSFTQSDYLSLAKLKTGSLFDWTFSAPIIYKFKNNNELIDQFSQIGKILGIIFQVQDDLLDFEDKTGKEKYIDYKNNNPNIVFSLSNHNKKPDFDDKSVDIKSFFEIEIFKARQLLNNNIQEITSITESLKIDPLYNLKIQKFINKMIREIQSRTN